MSSGLMRNSAQVASTSGRVYDLLPRRHSLKTLPFKAATLAATCKLQQSRIHSSSTSEVGQQFDGVFGKWTLDEQDRLEVLSYRAGLTVAAAALVLDSAIVLLPADNALKEALRSLQNVVAVVGASGLGASYFLIHIYVTPLKRFLQAMFALGTIGGLYLMTSQELPVTEYVAQHREAVWLVGPLFASVTGLGIKEGLCYGTPAAAGILLVTPLICLGHLSGWMPETGTRALLVALNLLAVVFAAGKYRQSLKGDIGDKSVFDLQKLPKEEQERRWQELRRNQ